MSKRRSTKSAEFASSRGPTGAVIWRDGAGHRFFWSGPGGRLKLMFGEQLVSIQHHTADGNYETAREAAAAVARFVAAAK
jgi:hypothetical protein